jgi:sulfide:quinone oxidoreductase
VHLNSEVTEIDGEGRSVVVTDNAAGTKAAIAYDFLHVVPPQSAPDWLKATPLADPANPNGYVEVDKNTMRHVRFPEVFALGDAGSTPNSKTGAAIRKQAPVAVENLLAVMDTTRERYDMWLLKRYGLPFMYWNLMLRGRA